MLAARLSKLDDVEARSADHGFAVRIYQGSTARQVGIVWMPLGEPTPTGLGEYFLWGRTGDEHRAPSSTGVDDLVALIKETLNG